MRDKDNWDKAFRVWFAACGVIAIGTIAGVVWLLVYVIPHIVAALDRIH